MNFPSSPTLNQEYNFGVKSWRWNGTAWQIISVSTTEATAAAASAAAAASSASSASTSATNAATSATSAASSAAAASTTLGASLLKANNLSDLTNATSARSNLGLGTLAAKSTVESADLAATLDLGTI
jgi:hypothetical protein